VASGVPSARVLVTNLYNLAQSLIRYELTDVFIRQPAGAGHGYPRARVQGRSDDVLRYDAIDVHPIVIRSVMVASPDVIDYQVNQTACGIDVFAVTSAGLDIDDLTGRLCRALAAAGLDHADVTVRRVEQLDRHQAAASCVVSAQSRPRSRSHDRSSIHGAHRTKVMFASDGTKLRGLASWTLLRHSALIESVDANRGHAFEPKAAHRGACSLIFVRSHSSWWYAVC
jgi:hypothetical protein